MTDMAKLYDLFVIGGGINGLGVARDAAGRGLNVGLCEKDDLGAHTSSASTKLIHGGLRYLEHYDFKLVRKSLIEREVLLKNAPHIIWPLRFVLPLGHTDRPEWLVRIGLFLYDNLGGRKLLPATSVIKRSVSNKLDALKDRYIKAFEFSDCWVDDARLCILNAVDAAARGADIIPQTKCIGLKRSDDVWNVTLQPQHGEVFEVQTKVLINAAGPWVEDVMRLSAAGDNKTGVRLVKGSHIITDKLYDGDHCFFFQNPDGRIFFAIPYQQGEMTLIGTTDVPFETSGLDKVAISHDEIDYLCESASAYFKRPITPDDVRATYSGVRPLYDDQSEDASKVTRDYVLKYNDHGAPVLSIFGGKITTYRTLSEHVLEQVSGALAHMGEPWTQTVALPGGDIEDADFDSFFRNVCKAYPALDPCLLRRLARTHGSRIFQVLGDAQSEADLGRHFGADLYETEIEFFIAEEFALAPEDVLFRRTKTGLRLSSEEQARLADWWRNRSPILQPSEPDTAVT